jgi:hypothetical protein
MRCSERFVRLSASARILVRARGASRRRTAHSFARSVAAQHDLAAAHRAPLEPARGIRHAIRVAPPAHGARRVRYAGGMGAA